MLRSSLIARVLCSLPTVLTSKRTGVCYQVLVRVLRGCRPRFTVLKSPGVEVRRGVMSGEGLSVISVLIPSLLSPLVNVEHDHFIIHNHHALTKRLDRR